MKIRITSCAHTRTRTHTRTHSHTRIRGRTHGHTHELEACAGRHKWRRRRAPTGRVAHTHSGRNKWPRAGPRWLGGAWPLCERFQVNTRALLGRPVSRVARTKRGPLGAPPTKHWPLARAAYSVRRACAPPKGRRRARLAATRRRPAAAQPRSPPAATKLGRASPSSIGSSSFPLHFIQLCAA